MAVRQWLKSPFIRFSALRVVTPFTPYVISNAFLASEVEEHGLRRLNPRSIDLAESSDWPTGECPIVFVQVDQLESFVDRISEAPGPFILITGKWGLPGLTLSHNVDSILANPHLVRWYSQNQIYENVPILPFPYGVNLTSAPNVYWRMRLQKVLGLGRSGVFLSQVTCHPHLEGPALEARGELADVMGPRLSLPKYLNKILGHSYVASPPGDRMDTYRHWESVALGAVPVSNLPLPLSGLFGECMVRTDSFSALVTNSFSATGGVSRPELATVEFWRAQVRKAP